VTGDYRESGGGNRGFGEKLATRDDAFPGHVRSPDSTEMSYKVRAF
jgi:hypothetical protein